jgi:hypothetical protein
MNLWKMVRVRLYTVINENADDYPDDDQNTLKKKVFEIEFQKLDLISNLALHLKVN